MNLLEGNLLWAFLAAFGNGCAGVKLRIPAGSFIGAGVTLTDGSIFLGEAKGQRRPAARPYGLGGRSTGDF